MTQTYGFNFFQDKCIQCHSCETACKSWRNLSVGLRFRRVKAIWINEESGIKNKSLSISCMHCLQPACRDACPEEAITKRESDGLVIVDADRCSGCQSCLAVCPFEIPQFGDDGKMLKCDMCLALINLETHAPPCVASCPTGALTCGLMTEEEKVTIEKKTALFFNVD